MPIEAKILDGTGDGHQAKVSTIGQVVTGAYAYDDVVFNELAEDNTAYNFYGPKHNQQFVITGIFLKADRQVSPTTDATIVVYEADDDTTTTIDKTLFQVAMVQGDQLALSPLNILVGTGKFVNAKTTDDDIHMTITGYYIPKLS